MENLKSFVVVLCTTSRIKLRIWLEILYFLPSDNSSKDACPLPPFKRDEDHRTRLRAELDAFFAKLYGLTEEELRYILDPQDVFGPDFPGETFRVLKEKEIRQFGEYRTKRRILEAWKKLEKLLSTYEKER